MSTTKKPADDAAPAAESPPAYPEASDLTIAQRICRVMVDADGVVKRGQTAFGERYSYARIDDVMAALREPMARHGLVLHWTQANREVGEYGLTKNGVMQWRHTVRVTFELHNADHADEAPWVTELEGDAIDTGDKGMGKALSYAFKNYLLKTFLLPSGDEADNEAREPEPARPAQKAQDPAEAEHRKAQSAFFAALNGEDIAKDIAKAWLKRNYELETTKDATVDQLRAARAWAMGYHKAQTAVQEVVSEAGLDLNAIATFIGETIGVQSPELMTLAEWADVLEFAKKAAEGEEPPGRGPMSELMQKAVEDLGATPEPEEES